MITPLSIREIADRIRLAARQTDDGRRRVTAESIARGELPPVPEPLSPPPSSVRGADRLSQETANSHPLEEAAGMVPRARQKTAVGSGVPGWLRPLCRNQGGFNDIVLEAVDRLVEANRQLQRQNQELHERLLVLHGWMNDAAQASSLQHDWMQAVQNRLRGTSEQRWIELEARLTRMEKREAETEPGKSLVPGVGEPVGTVNVSEARQDEP